MAGLNTQDSMVLVIDMQSRLLPAINQHESLLRRAQALVQAARCLDVPVVATEHCADKIGATVAALQPSIQRVQHKTHFDAAREPGFLESLPLGRPNVLLIGTEAHVCVLQTALGLLAAGRQPIIVADCIGSRRHFDLDMALKRFAHHGLELISSEMAMFEWLGAAGHPGFKEVLALIKSS